MRFISDLLYCVLSLSGLYFGACYQFGDSFMDVGNAILLNPSLPANKPPYGESILGNRTGRWSDGILICDYNIGGEKMIPYLAMTWNTSSLDSANNDISSLLNFAVAGSTVLNKSTLLGFCVTTPEVPDLGTQIDWFKSYFQSLCDTFGTSECLMIISATIYFGPFGGTDIIYALTQNKTSQEIMTMIPLIVNAIFEAATELINMGATDIQISQHFPLGCFPFARNYFSNVNDTLYDAYGCVESVNNLIMYMNNLILSTARNLSSIYITIVDYYNPTLSLIRDPPSEFNSTVALEPCCGNRVFNLSNQFCSGTDASLCDDPSKYIHWDEIHLTRTAYSYIYDKYGPV